MDVILGKQAQIVELDDLYRSVEVHKILINTEYVTAVFVDSTRVHHSRRYRPHKGVLREKIHKAV